MILVEKVRPQEAALEDFLHRGTVVKGGVEVKCPDYQIVCVRGETLCPGSRRFWQTFSGGVPILKPALA